MRNAFWDAARVSPAPFYRPTGAYGGKSSLLWRCRVAPPPRWSSSSLLSSSFTIWERGNRCLISVPCWFQEDIFGYFPVVSVLCGCMLLLYQQGSRNASVSNPRLGTMAQTSADDPGSPDSSVKTPVTSFLVSWSGPAWFFLGTISSSPWRLG